MAAPAAEDGGGCGAGAAAALTILPRVREAQRERLSAQARGAEPRRAGSEAGAAPRHREEATLCTPGGAALWSPASCCRPALKLAKKTFSNCSNKRSQISPQKLAHLLPRGFKRRDGEGRFGVVLAWPLFQLWSWGGAGIRPPPTPIHPLRVAGSKDSFTPTRDWLVAATKTFVAGFSARDVAPHGRETGVREQRGNASAQGRAPGQRVSSYQKARVPGCSRKRAGMFGKAEAKPNARKLADELIEAC